jgi:hypothetical protein
MMGSIKFGLLLIFMISEVNSSNIGKFVKEIKGKKQIFSHNKGSGQLISLFFELFLESLMLQSPS